MGTIAFAADFLAIAAAEVGAISERRLDDFWIRIAPKACRHSWRRSRRDSGLMVASTTAAGLVGENRRLPRPASVGLDSTSGMQRPCLDGWGAR